MLHNSAVHASFAERQGMDSIGRFALVINGDAEADQGSPNGSFGGRELAGNLPQRTLFHDVFLMEDGFVKSYWKCLNG